MKCVRISGVSTHYANLVLLFIAAFMTSKSIASDINYPYFATSERANQIERGFEKIRRGMDVSEVKLILGEPDEIKDLYEPKIKEGKVIGITFWYLIQRMKDAGSQNERQEKIVRVSFDLNGAVIGVDRW